MIRPAASERRSVEPGAISPSQALSALGVSGEVGKSGNEFLPPDVAFRFSVEPAPKNTIVARWEIADTYYLYRDKFQFALRNSSGVVLGDVVIPAGTIKDDPYFGSLQVFYETAQVSVALKKDETSTTKIILDVTYQGCTDLGLCYPPITKTVKLTVGPESN